MTTIAALLTVLAPAALSAIGLAVGRRWRSFARDAAVTGGLITLGAALLELTGLLRGDPVARIDLLGPVDTGFITLQLQLRTDQLSAVTAVMVALVALCVQVYSTAYFDPRYHHDHESPDRYASFAATVSLFTAAMMLVLHANDLVLLIIGWEGMGICSYLLVGYYSERASARAASMKAFLVTRVGDIGVLLAAVLLIAQAGTTSITRLTERTGELPKSVLATAAVLLLIGVAGKSAQFPLHTWLPDAMEGPTPISALIHAATMVAAGVFLVVRLLPVFLAGPVALQAAAVIAAITMLGAALVALAQDDLKKLLAWSTISQVAYMLAAASVAGHDGLTTGPAMYHLLSHGAFKALLFLAAGCVAHVVGGSTRLADMGGLLRSHPSLAWLFGLGLAGLAGLPPFGGFWSKESVLSAVEEAAQHGGGWSARLLVASGVITALVTGLYSGRAFAIVAMTPGDAPVVPHAPADHHGAPPDGPIEVPRAMMGALWVLAVPTALSGLLLLTPLSPLSGTHVDVATAFTGALLSFAGVAWGLSAPRLGARDIADALPVRLRAFLRAGYRLDDVQDALVVRPVQALARFVSRADTGVVDAPVRASATLTGLTGARVLRLSGGFATSYAAWAVAGALVVGVIGVVLS